MKYASLISAVFCVLLQAQSAPPTAPPKFDVVSVKPCARGAARGGDSSPGRLSIGCALLADTDNTGLIQQAYNRYASGRFTSGAVIPIEGGPDWIHSETFAIDAKSDGQPDIIMMLGPMLRGILEDRFKARIHRETRQGAVYEIALGKGTPKLKPLEEGRCIPAQVGHVLPQLAPGQRMCRNMVGPGMVNFEGGTLSMLAGLLGLIVDRPVIDKTGIAGHYEIQLKFSPSDSGPPRPASVDPGAPAARASDAPDVFQAFEEQLGLRRVPAKGPMDVLVIDHIERPSGN